MSATLAPTTSRQGYQVALLIALLVLAADLMTPLGVAVWLGYVVLMLVVAWSGRTDLVIGLAALSTVFILLGFFVSPAGIARATNVAVLIARRPGTVVAIVEDNGIGFDVAEAARTGRLGLIGMHERAELLGGRLSIESAPRHGTTVYLELSYPPQKDAGKEEP